ncbi:MAG: nuclear transport factor 2 family protein [Clostridia bacterium]|nr:nuclear transport factor 2 family protein [Clostridia bacterium]
MDTALSVVQRQLDFYNANDLKGFVSTYHDDVAIYNIADNTLMLQGKDALRLKYRERFEVQKVQAELVNRMVIGNKVIDHEHVSGIVKGEISKAVAIYEVEAALIKRVWFVFE